MKSLNFRRSLLPMLSLFSALSLATETSYNVNLTLTPTPTTLSSSGGTVKYNRTVSSTISTPQTLNYHGILTRPDGSQLPMTAELSMTLAAYENKTQTNLGFSIPNYYPAGDYRYRLYFHATANDYAAYSFDFKKSGSNPAPSPRVAVAQSSTTTMIPHQGGSATIKSVINNTSNYSDTLRVWTILTKANGDTKIVRAPTNYTVAAQTQKTLSDATLTLSGGDESGNYTITTYAMSTLRNTPAVLASNVIEKEDILIGTVQLPDPALQLCLFNQVAQKQWKYIKDVTELNCVDKGVVDISGLQALFALQKLNLADNDIIKADDARLPISLFTLDLSRNRLNDVWLSNGFVNLRNLYLAENRLRIPPAINLPNLVSIDLSYNAIKGGDFVQFLRGQPNLESVAAAGLVFENTEILTTLGSLFNLKAVDLSDTGLVINDLPFPMQIQSLRLANTHIRDSYVLSRFSQVNILDIENTNLSEINGITHFTQLQELNLSDNTIFQHDQLSNLVRANPGLRTLAVANIELPNNWLSSVFSSPMINNQLEDLNISYTNQRYIALPFANLKHLNISGNPLTGTFYPVNFNQLLSLRAANTRLNSIIIPLYEIPLQVLDLSGNSQLDPQTVTEWLRYASTLRELYLRNMTLPVSIDQYNFPAAENALQVFDIENAIIDVNIAMMRNLKTLNLNGHQSFNMQQRPVMIAPTPRLRSLSINHWHGPEWFAEQFNDLDELSVAYTRNLQRSFFESLSIRHPNLKRLSLAGQNLRSYSLSQLLNESRDTLRVLDLSDSQMIQQTLDSLAGLPSLREFNVSHNKLEHFYLGMTPAVQKLDLSYTELHYFDAYRPQMALPLRSLNLSGNPLQNFALANLLDNQRSLNQLSLDQVDLSAVDWNALSGSMQNIRSLSIANTQTIVNFSIWPALRELDISGNAVELPGLPSYIRHLKMNNVSTTQPFQLWRDEFGFKTLEISNLDIDPTLLRGMLSDSVLLQQLNIDGISFDGVSLNALLSEWFGETGSSALRSLNISNTGIQLQQMPMPLFNLRELSVSGLGLMHSPDIQLPLTHLDISHNPLQYGWLPWPSQLKSLNMSAVPAEPLATLSNQFAQMSSLSELSLANNNIADLNPLQLPALRRIDLRGNQLTTTDGLPQTPLLHHIDLSANQLQQLLAINGMHEGLRSINLSDNTNLACAEVNRLQWLSPTIKVTPPSHCSSD